MPERHSEAILNNTLPGIKKVYNRYIYDKEKQKALKKWSDHLEKLIKLTIDPDLLPALSNGHLLTKEVRPSKIWLSSKYKERPSAIGLVH
jgi:hypothetical protein